MQLTSSQLLDNLQDMLGKKRKTEVKKISVSDAAGIGTQLQLNDSEDDPESYFNSLTTMKVRNLSVATGSLAGK